MVPCTQCGKDLSEEGKNSSVASISGSIMGDECTESFFFCKDCQVYTIKIWHDRFLGEEDISYRGPLAKNEGDDDVRLIKECATPWDKKCRCEAHCAYFGEWLD